MLKNSQGEDLKQFFRRCDTWLKFDKEFIYFRGFNDVTGDYAINITAIRNLIENLYKKQENSYIEKWKNIGLLKEEDCKVETLGGDQWLYHKPAEDIEGVDEVLAYMEQSPKYIRLGKIDEEATEMTSKPDPRSPDINKLT